MRFISALPQTLSLAGILMLLAANACVIVNNGDGDDDDDDDACVELDEVCPSLACDNGNVVVDGCAICECNEVCDPGPAPECAFPVLLDEACRWTCGTGSCFADGDCGPGSICVFSDTTEETPRDQADPPEGGEAFPQSGVCVVVDTRCVSDADCGQGFFCDFANDGGGAVPSPDSGDDSVDDSNDNDSGDRAAPPAPQGQCRVLPAQCFSDLDCRDGQTCEVPDVSNGLVAPGGVCVDQSECESDVDCGSGETCAVECRSDPGCPLCDVCFPFGICIAVETRCFEDAGCAEGEFCDLTGGSGDRDCRDDNNDGLCDDGSDPVWPAPDGVCRPLEVDACASVRCAEGSCIVTQNGPVCVADDNRCVGDNECAEGTVCNAGTDVCLSPPDCDPAVGCLAVCYGFCVDAPTTCFGDTDCAEGEVCVFDPTIDQGGTGERPIIAPQGVCEPAPTTCAADTECGRGERCSNGQCTSTSVVGCEAIRCITGTECIEDAAGNGSCVASIGECASTEECPTGSTCNAGDVCNAPPDCERGQLCADVCYGYCVAD